MEITDTFRHFNQEVGHFSWWDYRAASFRRNQGLRIDHILANQPLISQCLSCVGNFYVNPIIRYNLNSPRLRSIEFSSRYEYLNPNYQLDGNVRKTITPMLNLEFADQYFACLQIGAMIDDYKRNVPLTSEYDHTTLFAQVQVRF